MAKLATLLNHRRNDNKKSVCMAAVEILPGDLEAGVEEVGVNLPERAVVREIYVLTEADHDAGDLTVKSYDAAGVADGIIDETFTSLDTATQGVTANQLAAYVYTGTGIELRMATTALMSVGIIQVCIIYDEPKLSTGMLTAVV